MQTTSASSAQWLQQTDSVQMEGSCIDRKQINPVNVCLADLLGYGMYLQTNELK